MFGLNQAIIVAKIAEMKEISAEEIKNALNEQGSTEGNELYAILCAYLMQPDVERDEDELRSYANALIEKVESVLAREYDKKTRSAVIDFFVLSCKRNTEDIDKIICRCTTILEEHKNCKENTLEWFLMEDIKRQLLSVYAYSRVYLKELKALIVEIQATEKEYTNYIAKL